MTRCCRVVCEFAQSRKHIKTFDFDFVGSSCHELHSLIVAGTELRLSSTRLFHNHQGPELTTHFNNTNSQHAKQVYENLQLNQVHLQDYKTIVIVVATFSRVLCEHAGSGQRFASFNFDFLGCDVAQLQKVVCKLDSSQFDVSQSKKKHWQHVRLFHEHNGLELTSNPGAFGVQKQRANVLAIQEYKRLQELQTQKKDVVLAAAYYEDVDIAVLSLSMPSSIVSFLQCKDVLNARNDHVFLIADTDFYKTVRVLRSQLLSSANFMYYLFNQYQRTPSAPTELLSQALCDDFFFMAECRCFSHQASQRLLHSKDFAVLAFAKKRALQLCSLYNLLSLSIQSDKEIVLLALRSEGTRVLDVVPKHLFDDRGFVMALIVGDSKAWDFASDTLRQDAMVAKLSCSAKQTAKFADLTLSDAADYSHAIRVSLGSVADDVLAYLISERMKLIPST